MDGNILHVGSPSSIKGQSSLRGSRNRVKFIPQMLGMSSVLLQQPQGHRLFSPMLNCRLRKRRMVARVPKLVEQHGVSLHVSNDKLPPQVFLGFPQDFGGAVRGHVPSAGPEHVLAFVLPLPKHSSPILYVKRHGGLSGGLLFKKC